MFLRSRGIFYRRVILLQLKVITPRSQKFSRLRKCLKVLSKEINLAEETREGYPRNIVIKVTLLKVTRRRLRVLRRSSVAI